MSKFIMAETSDILLEGELLEGEIYIHVEFIGEKFTKTVYRNLLSEWAEVLRALKDKGFSAVYSLVPEDPKIMKWQDMFGMTPTNCHLGSIVYMREL